MFTVATKHNMHLYGIISLAIILFWNIYERRSNKVAACIQKKKKKYINKSHKSIFFKLFITQSQPLTILTHLRTT